MIELPLLDWGWVEGYPIHDGFKVWSWYITGRKWSYDVSDQYQSLYLDSSDRIVFDAYLPSPIGIHYDVIQLWLDNISAQEKEGSGCFITRLNGRNIRPRQFLYAIVDPYEWGNNLILNFDGRDIAGLRQIRFDLEYHGVPLKIKSFEPYGVLVG
jgi:hypothetical protein